MELSATVHVWRTGSVLIDQSLAFREKTWHPMPYSGWFRSKSKQIEVPVTTYLIEHPEGNILVDAGWNERIRNRQKQHLGILSYSMFKGKLPKGESVKERLKEHGLQPSDLDYVILTHMHADHVSGVEHVKQAKNILTSAEEWRAAQKDIGYRKSMWSEVPIETFTMQDIPYGPFYKGIDLFKDQSVLLVHTPGHSKGLLSILVETSSGWVLLASDVGYGRRSLEENRLPGLIADRSAAQKSLDWVRGFSKREDCRTVLFNHDPEVMEGVFE